MITAEAFVEPLRAPGYASYAGVPCSFLTPFINHVIDEPRLDYVGATSEGEAAGISFGAHLAGQGQSPSARTPGWGTSSTRSRR